MVKSMTSPEFGFSMLIKLPTMNQLILPQAGHGYPRPRKSYIASLSVFDAISAEKKIQPAPVFTAKRDKIHHSYPFPGFAVQLLHEFRVRKGMQSHSGLSTVTGDRQPGCSDRTDSGEVLLRRIRIIFPGRSWVTLCLSRHLSLYFSSLVHSTG